MPWRICRRHRRDAVWRSAIRGTTSRASLGLILPIGSTPSPWRLSRLTLGSDATDRVADADGSEFDVASLASHGTHRAITEISSDDERAEVIYESCSDEPRASSANTIPRKTRRRCQICDDEFASVRSSSRDIRTK